MKNKYIFKLSQKTPLYVSDILNYAPGLTETEVTSSLKRTLKTHYTKFGTEPYRIQYDRKKDSEALFCGPVIGLLNCGPFDIEIKPKFEGLEIGKCLQLAHECNFYSLVRHENEVVEKNVSGKFTLSGVEYFSKAFLSSVYDVVNSGLTSNPCKESGPDPKFRGKLNISKHVTKTSLPTAPFTSRSARDYSTTENRLLLTALNVCLKQCENQTLKSITSSLIKEFSNVYPIDSAEINFQQTEFSFPRPEYEKALTLARIILEGFDPIRGAVLGFVPYFTIDLDRLFETYVGFKLINTIKEPNTVYLQPKYSHPSNPEFNDKFIMPDIEMRTKDGYRIVLDTKNKYSLISNEVTSIQNSDIYQIYYYCRALDADLCVLIYPGNSQNYTRYPIKGSEGKEAYELKKKRAIERINTQASSSAILFEKGHSVRIVFWRLNLEGTISDTEYSIAQLSAYLVGFSEK